jgi:hypothetical protein
MHSILTLLCTNNKLIVLHYFWSLKIPTPWNMPFKKGYMAFNGLIITPVQYYLPWRRELGFVVTVRIFSTRAILFMPGIRQSLSFTLTSGIRQSLSFILALGIRQSLSFPLRLGIRESLSFPLSLVISFPQPGMLPQNKRIRCCADTRAASKIIGSQPRNLRTQRMYYQVYKMKLSCTPFNVCFEDRTSVP